MTSQGAGRRSEYAALTRQAILDAARKLFVEQGFFATRVEDIAREARVAVPTVYAAAGGKGGLLRTLVEDGVRQADSGDLRQRIAANTDPAQLLEMIVRGTGNAFETWSPVMRQVTAAAEQDPSVRQALDTAHASLRAGLTATAVRLGEMGALREGLSVESAADVLWYFLGNSSYYTLTDDCRWPLERSVDWLLECLTVALVGKR